MSNLPAGAQFDNCAPFNKKEIDFEPLIEKYTDYILHQSTIPFDEIGYLIDLLRDSKHYETINEILLNYDE